MKNEELRMKKRAALPPLPPQAFPKVFMTHHKAIGNTCESRGFFRASGTNPNSSFFILHSSFTWNS